MLLSCLPKLHTPQKHAGQHVLSGAWRPACWASRPAILSFCCAYRYLLAPNLEDPHQQLEAASGSQRTAGGAGTAAAAAAVAAAGDPPGGFPPSDAAAAAAAGQGLHTAAGGGSPVSTDGSDTSSIAGLIDGNMTLLVLEYCSLGNLHKAIAAGRFRDARRQPNLVRPAAAAAPGLGSQHGSQCCMQLMAPASRLPLSHRGSLISVGAPHSPHSPTTSPPVCRTGCAAPRWMWRSASSTSTPSSEWCTGMCELQGA